MKKLIAVCLIMAILLPAAVQAQSAYTTDKDTTTGNTNLGGVAETPGKVKDPQILIAAKNWDELVKMGAPAVESLIKALTDKNNDVRGQAAIALGLIKDPRAIKPLIGALKDNDSLVCWYATGALGRIKEAFVPLINLLKDKDESIRYYAGVALGQSKDIRAIEPLIDAYRDNPDNRFSDNFIRELKFFRLDNEPANLKLKERVIDVLVEAFNKGGLTSRWEAFYTLQEIKDNPKVNKVIEPLLKDSVLHDICELGANPWGNPDGGGNCKWAAARLGLSKDVRALEPLKTAMNFWVSDSEVIGACRNAIAEIEKGKK